MTTIDQTVWGRCPIPYPALKEQTAIAEAVSDADNLIFYLQKLIEKKKAIKQGSIQELLLSLIHISISGRVNRNFFMEKFCYGKTGKEG